MTEPLARPVACPVLALAAATAILATACGALPFASPGETSDTPPGPGETAAPQASPSAVTDPGVAAGQIAGEWRRLPSQLADSQVAIVSDACAAKARPTHGDAVADLPTAVVDARGSGIVTAIFSDDAQAMVCYARIDGSGQARVDGVDTLATTSFEPQDGTSVTVTELTGLDDPPGERTLAFGRVGPDPAQVRLTFPDGSNVVTSSDNGWWLGWWPGGGRPDAIAALDGHGAAVSSAAVPTGEVESRLGSAAWWLDPTKRAPGPNDTVVPIKILEESCASGASGVDRLDPPSIELTDTTIVVTLGIKRQPGAQDCQGNQPFSFDLELPEPLMNRTLLDGSSNPPREVTKPPSG